MYVICVIDCMVPSCILLIYLGDSFFDNNKFLITYIKKNHHWYCSVSLELWDLLLWCLIQLQLCWPLGRWIWAKLNSGEIWMVASLCLIWCFWRERICTFEWRVTSATSSLLFSRLWMSRHKIPPILHFSFHGLLKWLFVQILIYLFFKFVIVFFFSLSLYSPHELE